MIEPEEFTDILIKKLDSIRETLDRHMFNAGAQWTRQLYYEHYVKHKIFKKGDILNVFAPSGSGEQIGVAIIAEAEPDIDRYFMQYKTINKDMPAPFMHHSYISKETLMMHCIRSTDGNRHVKTVMTKFKETGGKGKLIQSKVKTRKIITGKTVYIASYNNNVIDRMYNWYCSIYRNNDMQWTEEIVHEPLLIEPKEVAE